MQSLLLPIPLGCCESETRPGCVGGILLLRFLMLEPRSVVLTGNVTSGFTVGIFVPWGLGQGSEVIPEIKQRGGLSRHQSWVHTGQC